MYFLDGTLIFHFGPWNLRIHIKISYILNLVLGYQMSKTFIFEYFPKNSFRNELNAPFLHYFDTHDLTCKNFHFVRRGAPGGPRTLKKNLWYLKIISTRVCKKIFLIKAKKLFCTWCPKSAVHPRTQNFWIFFFHRGIRKKMHMIRNFEYGLLEDFLSKWQKS